jgi:N6-L-threonylcarbamoyladenine synthase
MQIYVISKYNKPLMPTTPRTARLLLERGTAAIVKRVPFTIMLTHRTKHHTQPITLGMGAGSKTIGISAFTETQERLAAELKPRNNVIKLLSTCRLFRTYHIEC